MRGSLIIGCGLVGLLLAAGCGTKSGGDPEATTASISGGQNDAAQKASDPAAVAPTQERRAAPTYPVVAVETTAGTFKIRLLNDRAWNTVDNFLHYVKSGHYDNTIFHMVLKEQVIVGGAFTPKREEKPTRVPIYNEAHKCGLSNKRATVGMVRAAGNAHSATCQFYLNLVDNPDLDFKAKSDEEWGYCVFGDVIEGMEIVDRIASTPVKEEHFGGTDFRVPVEDVVIRSIRQIQ